MKNAVLRNGMVLGEAKIDTIEDIDELRSAIYTAPNSNYGHMSRCMASGMHNGWDDGVCRIYLIDKDACTCKEWHEEFEKLLKVESNKPYQTT